MIQTYHVSVCNDFGQSPPFGLAGVYDKGMKENETAPAPLTDTEMAALLAAHGMALPVPVRTA